MSAPTVRAFWEKAGPISLYVALLAFLDVQSDRGYEHGDSSDHAEQENDPHNFRGSLVFFVCRAWIDVWHWLHGHGNAEALLAVFTILLMVVTAGLWFHTRAIAFDAKESSRDQAKLTRISLRIALRAGKHAREVADRQSWEAYNALNIASDNAWSASKSASAASSTAAIMQSTAERQLRAYVGVKKGYLRVRRITNSKRVLAELSIVNAGATTAANVRLAIHVEVRDSTNGTFDVSFRDEVTYLVPGFAWDVQQVTPPGVDISAELEKQLIKREKFLVAWGEIAYLDAFGIQRRSRFRFRQGLLHEAIATFGGSQKFSALGGGVSYVDGWDVAPCEDGNDAT
jgi:hypothetical protein